jgi:anti-sigma factor ChrR (cupin superfamily)
LTPEERREEIQSAAALYAFGALTQHEAGAFEAQLAEDEFGVAELAAFEDVVASLGLSAPECAPSRLLRGRLMDRIASQAERKRGASLQSSFINLRVDQGEWDEIAPGVHVKILFTDGQRGATTTLLRLQPGAKIERHLHSSPEQCYILEGDFRVNNQILGPGDFHVALPGSVHELITTNGGALSLIVAQG